MFNNNRSRRAVAIVALSLTAGLVLTSCGRADSAGSDASAIDALDDQPATGELNIWAQADEAAALPAFAEEFLELNPDLTINVTALPWDAAHNKYQTAIAAGTTPDMAQMGTTWMADFSGAFTPVPEGIDTSGFFEGSLSTNMVGDQLFGVPWYVDTRVFYFRKDLAETAGFPDGAQTWEEFKEFTKALQTEAGAEYGVGLPSSGTDAFQSMLMFPWSNGAEITNADQTEWTLDSPEWVEAMEYYESFFSEGIANPDAETGAGSGESEFVSGKTPVLTGGPSLIGSLTAAGGGEDYKDMIGVMRVPEEVSSTSFTGGSNLVVFEKSQNPEAAWKFARWLSEPDVQVRWQQAVGDLPAVESAWDDPALADDPLLSVLGEQLTDTNSPPTLTTWTQVSAQADKALEQIIRAGADPAQAMADLQSAAESIGTGQ
ncbi:extracellular solute-binding protein [Microbacterium sp. NPDC076911]|uniref:extracellular solute-binding protein n=1 Tax=Microbacterium sp. NPDC076911 TaxID=3154958 RepID=UPI0034204188